MFNYGRVPRNLYRTCMNYTQALKRAVSGFIVYLAERVTATSSLSGFNEQNIATSVTIDPIQPLYVIAEQDNASSMVELSGYNLNSSVLSDNINISLTENVSISSLIPTATNTEVFGVTAFDKGITYTQREQVTTTNIIPTATNTEVFGVTAFFDGITNVTREQVTTTNIIPTATNTEVFGVTAFDKGITYTQREQVTTTNIIPTATNTEVFGTSAFFDGITNVTREQSSINNQLSGLNALYYNLSTYDLYLPIRTTDELASTSFITSGSMFLYENIMNFDDNTETNTESSSSTFVLMGSCMTFPKIFQLIDLPHFESVFPYISTVGYNGQSGNSGFNILNRYNDSDADAYFALVEAADGQPLEIGIKTHITEFISQCKNLGFWSSVSNCYLFAGPRTLTGALIPLKGGISLTNNGFNSSEYNRKRLQGNGTAFLDLNINSSTSNSFHSLVWKENIVGSTQSFFGDIVSSTTPCIHMNTNGSSRHKTLNMYTPTPTPSEQAGLFGINRNTTTLLQYETLYGNVLYNTGIFNFRPEASYTSKPLTLFKVDTNPASTIALSFFSIGNSIDLVEYGKLVNRLIYHMKAYSS